MAEEENKQEEPEQEEQEESKVEEKEQETPQEKSPLEESKEILGQLKEQNKVMSDNLKKAEKLSAEQLLGGRSSAGGVPQTKEEKSVANAREFLKGTGFEDEIFPTE